LPGAELGFCDPLPKIYCKIQLKLLFPDSPALKRPKEKSLFLFDEDYRVAPGLAGLFGAVPGL
jgi:hypothetical protein